MPYPVAAVRGKNFGISAEAYMDKVAAIESANLIAYWTLIETSGTTADNYEGTAARDGEYKRNVTTMGTGTGIGDGNTAPDFDGADDCVDVYTSSFNTAFSGAEGTVAIWAKVSGSGVWTDGTRRQVFFFMVNGENYVDIRKTAGNNELQFVYEAGDTLELITKGSLSETGWMHFAITWSKSGNAVKAYYNGSQEGSTQTGLGTWAGNFLDGYVNIGAQANSTTVEWDGNLAHCSVYDKALAGSDILSMATV